MHGLLPSQRTTTLTPGDHHASSFRECGATEPSAPPHSRSVPAESSEPSRWLGLAGESARSRGQSIVHNAPAGIAETIPPATPAATSTRIVSFLFLAAIRFYRACISPVLRSNCRFHPSCSAYAYEAVEKWGPWKGARLAVGRLLRCRPWGKFGFDPVPEIEGTGSREQVTE